VRTGSRTAIDAALVSMPLAEGRNVLQYVIRRPYMERFDELYDPWLDTVLHTGRIAVSATGIDLLGHVMVRFGGADKLEGFVRPGDSSRTGVPLQCMGLTE
jgi:hypothetical protein